MKTAEAARPDLLRVPMPPASTFAHLPDRQGERGAAANSLRTKADGRARPSEGPSYPGQKSAALAVKVADAAPGMFSADFRARGRAQSSTRTAVTIRRRNPAAAGSVVVLFGT